MSSDINTEKRLNIGFLIHHLDNDYSKALLKGASSAARELNVNLVIFPGRSLNCQLDDNKYTVYEYQHNVAYSYVSSKMLDAAVVSAGTLGSFVTKSEFEDFLNGYNGLPIITTENKVGAYPCVRMDSSGIKDLVNHLIKYHGKKNIAFVSGPKGNADADERLHYYIEALEENGLIYDPDMVAYGKFSEYCVDIVGDLIDRNEGRIDAICFANDMMCKGGYKAIEKRGLRVGEDIAVTGYDDSEIAVSLKPTLTTVKADAARLGSCAVYEAVKLAKGEFDGKDIDLGSTPVYRFSCGCLMQPKGFASTVEKMLQAKEPKQAADRILAEFIPQYDFLIESNESIKGLRDFAEKLFKCAIGEISFYEHEAIFTKAFFSRIIDEQFFSVATPEALVNIIKQIRISAEEICESDNIRFKKITSVVESCMDTVSRRIISMHYGKVQDLTFTHFLIGNITKDMTLFGNDAEKCYFSIVNNLYRVHIDSSFIYIFEDPVIHSAKTEWYMPETLYLNAYHDGDKLAAVTGEARKVRPWNIINNDFTPDRRRTLVVSPLFMNDEQYGVIVFEMENEYFPYVYSITPQICSAIKLTNLVAQLENSLDAAHTRNKMLNKMSMSDELTGVYNRRGFNTFANRMLKAPENEGRHAAIIFGDLDNLKTINDTFGHEDGDYAIISAASFLKNGLRNSDIIGRIGGDEFAAFAICDDNDIISKLPSRIKNIAKLHNLRSDKPYNVTISIGICELICSPELNIQEFLEKADSALYEDKKNKNRDIMKHDDKQ